jgi:hypothetical protein
VSTSFAIDVGCFGVPYLVLTTYIFTGRRGNIPVLGDGVGDPDPQDPHVFGPNPEPSLIS